MRLELVEPTYFAASAVSGVGAILTAMSDIALQLFGMPLPVLMAAAAGAFLARSYLPAAKFWVAFLGSIAWTVVACVAAPVVPAVAARFGVELPATAAMAPSAALIAALAPLLWPIVVEKLRQITKNRLDRYTGGGKDGKD